MPRGNGTGPSGMGSMTGRGAGFCAGSKTPGYMNPVPGRGMRFGRGRGLGRALCLGGLLGGSYLAYRWMKNKKAR